MGEYEEKDEGDYHQERIDLRSEEKELIPSQDGIEAITLSMDSGIATLAKQNCASPEEQRGFSPLKIWNRARDLCWYLS